MTDIETRPCGRCGGEVATITWNTAQDDHLVIAETPLAFETVDVDPRGQATIRVSQRIALVWCSEIAWPEIAWSPVEPCPECRQGKHPNCDGTTWDLQADGPAACPCAEGGHR